MQARPEEARAQDRPYEQKGLLGPDGNWLSKRARQKQAGSSAVASPVEPQKFDGLTGNWLHFAGDSSEDGEGWRVEERYCIKHRAAMDMH